VSDYTIGDFATALEGLIASLDGIADDLKECDQAARIDNTPGIKIICGLPILMSGNCVAPESPTGDFSVADLVVTVEDIKDWITDIRSKLANYDATTEIDSGDWSPREETQA
jgi:hypothetical protein